jgi:hypothetical protein
LATVSTAEPNVQLALGSCIAALRRLAQYELDAALARRLEELSERKEFLDAAGHDELMALVHFTQQRTMEKLEAQLALNRLRTILPDLVGEN